MNKGKLFIGILAVFLLASFSFVSAKSSNLVYYDNLLRRSDNYNIYWEGPYKGGNLYVEMQGPKYTNYDYGNYYGYAPYYQQPMYCSSLGCYRNMWSYDVDFYGPQKYPSSPGYGYNYGYYHSYPASYVYKESIDASYSRTVEARQLYADRYYGYVYNNFDNR